MAEIRHAREEDLPTLLALGRLMHSESPVMRVATYDADRVRKALLYAMNLSGVVLVHVDAEGQIDGGLAGVLNERWFSPERQFVDLALFVRPDRRGGLTAARLVRALKDWCRGQGLRPCDVQMAISTGVLIEQTGALLEALNFEKTGGIYRLREF